MPNEYLDSIGLSYFWQKLKAWCSSLFALDSNVVHKTGDEQIYGIKEFINSYHDSTRPEDANKESSSILVRMQNYDKGTISNYSKFANVIFLDKAGTNLNWNGRLGSVECGINANNLGNYAGISVYKNEVIDGVDTHDNASINVGFDAYGKKYAIAPSTSENSNRNTDILTRDWIPKDTRIVHTTGNETITGSKIFNSEIERSTMVSGETALKSFYSSSFSSGDFVYIHRFNTTNGSRRFFIRCYPAGVNGDLIRASFDTLLESGSSANFCGSLYVGRDGSGINYASATSTSELRTVGGDILTRDWIPKDTRIVHTTGDENISGNKIFSNNIQLSNVSPTVIITNTNFSKGVIPTNSNRYWNVIFYDKNGTAAANQIGSFYQRLDKNTGNQHLIMQLVSGSGTDETVGVEVYRSSTQKLFYPLSDNSISLGYSNFRWSAVWAATGSINTSDERLKSFIASVPDSVLDCWDGVSFRQFKFNDSVAEKGADRARLHVGLVAQEIDAAFAGSGLDVSAYGFFCHDSWEAEEAVYDNSGNLEKEARPAGDRYSLRYEEALCMEAACQRRENARLKKRIAGLEERLAALELKVS